MSNRYLHLFRGEPDKSRKFPSPIETVSDDNGVGWKLRYAPDSLTREDRMYAASILDAYAYLVCHMTAKERQSVVSEIRRQLAVRTT